MATIRLDNLCKRYENGFQAVDHLNLVVYDGEFLVLVGPSGCGKSTTLRMIAGLEDVTSGDIFLGNRSITNREPGQRDIAMVFQNYALYPHMTVRDNLSFGLRMRKTPKDEIQRRVTEVAQILSLEPLLDRRPKQLSGGQRQRVAVGRAIVRQPQAFLFDEPLSNLDAKLRVQMRTELSRLHQRLKTTTVYVTHDQVEAMTLGDRIVVMKDGIIQQVDSPINVYQYPANRFVAGFIGSPAMNFLPGEIIGHHFQSGRVNYQLSRGGQQVASRALADKREVICGFRPESLTLDRSHPVFAEVTVDVVEHMGHETVIYFNLPPSNSTVGNASNQGEHANLSTVARLPGQATVASGDSLTLHLPDNGWYLFESRENENGQQLRIDV